MKRSDFRNREARRGAALVEFAVISVVLLMLTMGTADFGRLFYHGITSVSAAGAGSIYGSLNTVRAGDYTEIQQRVAADSTNLTGVSATADQYCACPNSTTEIPCADIHLGANVCAGYGVPRAYVRVRVQQTFTTLGVYPGIPSSIPIDRRAWMRVR